MSETRRRSLLSLQRRLATATLPHGARLADDGTLVRQVNAPFVLLGALVLIGAATAPYPQVYWMVMASEQGVVENVTAFIAFYGAWVAVQLVRHAEELPHRWMAGWFGCFVVGLGFVGLEEISWGQQWFFWETPHWIGLVNTQGETNLHNLAKWSEEVPKLLLSLAAVVAGVLVPLWIAWRGPIALIHATPLRDIWPSASLWPSALIALVIRLIERVVANQPGADSAAPLFRSLREGLEIFLVMFVVAYLLDMRLRHLGAPEQAPSSMRPTS